MRPLQRDILYYTIFPGKITLNKRKARRGTGVPFRLLQSAYSAVMYLSTMACRLPSSCSSSRAPLMASSSWVLPLQRRWRIFLGVSGVKDLQAGVGRNELLSGGVVDDDGIDLAVVQGLHSGQTVIIGDDIFLHRSHRCSRGSRWCRAGCRWPCRTGRQRWQCRSPQAR